MQDGVEENNRFVHNFAGFVHPLGAAAGGFDQTGSLHIEVGRSFCMCFQ